MGWEKGGRYYTRSRRVNGKVKREYVGSGVIAHIAYELDLLERAERQAERRERKDRERAEREAIDARYEAIFADVTRIEIITNYLMRAELEAAGYYQHAGGEWRKRGKQHAKKS